MADSNDINDNNEEINDLTPTNDTPVSPSKPVTSGSEQSSMAEFVQRDKIRLQPISEEMRRSYINYAMSVIVARALPDARDGLKPVQRRIIYSMYKLGIINTSGYKKSARTVGDVIAKYHPHGDVAVYDAMVRMAQDFNMRYMLIDGQGNFGSIDGDSAAAMRYTESRLQKISMEIVEGLAKNTVDYVANYDGNTQEPTVMPSNLPTLLLNGADGIAVGMATKIPPHNLKELVGVLRLAVKKGTASYSDEGQDKDYAKQIKNTEDLKTLNSNRFPKFETDVDVEEMLDIMPGPDFPTGAEIYDREAMKEMYSTGRGRFMMRAVARIEELRGGRYQIVITEIPYQVNKARLVAKIASLVKDRKVEGISDIRDESNREGMRVVIEIKRDGKPKTVLNKLYKFTEMQKSFNTNMLALVNNEPQTINLKGYSENFISHRQIILIREHEFELAKAKEREHILEGLLIALDNLDEVINTIRSSKDSDVAKDALMKKFKLSEIQAVAILDMQLRKLAALERQKLIDEYKEIQAKITDILDILSNPARVLLMIDAQLVGLIEKYGDDRRTKVFKGKIGEFSEEDLVAKEDVIVTVSEKGYIKRLKEDSYVVQHRGGKGKIGMTTSEDDAVAHLFFCTTHDDIMFFTNKGKVYTQKVYEIPEYGRTAKGQAVINLINIDTDERVTSILTRGKDGIVDEDMTQENEEGKEKKEGKFKFLFMSTSKGTVKKTSLEEYENIRSNGLIAINLASGDDLTWVKPTHGVDEIILVTKHGKSIRFHEEDVRPTGRASMGVRGIKLKEDDEVIAADVVRTDENLLLTIAEEGFGKTTKLEQFARQNRGGQGIFAARTTDKTGRLVAARLLDHPQAELLIMSEHGQVVRIKTEDLPQRNRQTSGVKLINVKQDDRVAAIAIV
jgi:DNA gyrase subunit A